MADADSHDLSDAIRLEQIAEQLIRIAQGARDRASGQSGTLLLASLVRSILEARQVRARHLDAQLFSDPAWDMLLYLFVAHLEGESIFTTKLCAASGVGSTTALRWIDNLEKRELVSRTADPMDTRRVIISLTDAGADKMTRIISDAAVLTQVLT